MSSAPAVTIDGIADSSTVARSYRHIAVQTQQQCECGHDREFQRKPGRGRPEFVAVFCTVGSVLLSCWMRGAAPASCRFMPKPIRFIRIRACPCGCIAPPITPKPGHGLRWPFFSTDISLRCSKMKPGLGGDWTKTASHGWPSSPEQRYPTAADLAVDLNDWLQARPVSAVAGHSGCTGRTNAIWRARCNALQIRADIHRRQREPADARSMLTEAIAFGTIIYGDPEHPEVRGLRERLARLPSTSRIESAASPAQVTVCRRPQ